MTTRGAWSGSTSYQKFDLVTHSSAVWSARVAVNNSGHVPGRTKAEYIAAGFSQTTADNFGFDGGTIPIWKKVLGPNGENDISKITKMCPVSNPVTVSGTLQFDLAGSDSTDYRFKSTSTATSIWQINARALTHNDVTYDLFGPALLTKGQSGTQGQSGSQGQSGNTGSTGSAGSAISFDTDSTVESTNALKTAAIRATRGEDVVLINDIYWHIETGRIFRATSGIVGTTQAAAFAEIGPSGGFINGQNITSSSFDITKLSEALTDRIGFNQLYSLPLRFDQFVYTDENETDGGGGGGSIFVVPAPDSSVARVGNLHGSSYATVRSVSKRQSLDITVKLEVTNTNSSPKTIAIEVDPQVKSNSSNNGGVDLGDVITYTSSENYGQPDLESTHGGIDIRSLELKDVGGGAGSPEGKDYLTKLIGTEGYVSDRNYSSAYSDRVLGVWNHYNGKTILQYQAFNSSGDYTNYNNAYWSLVGWATEGSWAEVGYGSFKYITIPPYTSEHVTIPRHLDFGYQTQETQCRLKLKAYDVGRKQEHIHRFKITSGYAYGTSNGTSYKTYSEISQGYQRESHAPLKSRLFHIDSNEAFHCSSDLIAYSTSVAQDNSQSPSSSVATLYSSFKEFGTVTADGGTTIDTNHTYAVATGTHDGGLLSDARTYIVPNLIDSNGNYSPTILEKLVYIFNSNTSTMSSGFYNQKIEFSVRGTFPDNAFECVNIGSTQLLESTASRVHTFVNLINQTIPVTTWTWYQSQSDFSGNPWGTHNDIVQKDIYIEGAYNQVVTETMKGIDVRLVEVSGQAVNSV